MGVVKRASVDNSADECAERRAKVAVLEKERDMLLAERLGAYRVLGVPGW